MHQHNHVKPDNHECSCKKVNEYHFFSLGLNSAWIPTIGPMQKFHFIFIMFINVVILCPSLGFYFKRVTQISLVHKYILLNNNKSNLKIDGN